MNSFKQFYLLEDEKYKLYCDLDSVLVDFFKGFDELSPNKSFKEYEKEDNESQAWKLIYRAKDKWWADLPWMKDGKELWEYIKAYNPTILSSPGRSNIEMVTKGKVEWIKRELGKNIKYIIERDKSKYAKDEKTILIDDNEKKIDQWINAGGTGILHKSTKETIEELKKLEL